MLHIFPVEPRDGWAKGDLAYCVNPTRRSHPRLERGRIYRVADAMKPSNIGHHGLKLEGVDTGESWGFCSNRFIKLSSTVRRLDQIAASTEYGTAHYWPWCGTDAAWRLAKRLARSRAARGIVSRQGEDGLPASVSEAN